MPSTAPRKWDLMSPTQLPYKVTRIVIVLLDTGIRNTMQELCVLNQWLVAQTFNFTHGSKLLQPNQN